MLQPDEIIIQKEWHQLSAAEKEQLAELAGSEAAFNLLKKMLVVSAEEAGAAPQLSPEVYQNVVAALPARKINARKYWLAVAAVIAIALSATLFLLKKEQRQDFVKINDQPVKKDSAIKSNDLIVQQDEDTAINNIKTDSSPKQRLVQTNHNQKRNIHKSPLYHITDTSLQNVYVVQTTVASDPSLLGFISEAE